MEVMGRLPLCRLIRRLVERVRVPPMLPVSVADVTEWFERGATLFQISNARDHVYDGFRRHSWNRCRTDVVNVVDQPRCERLAKQYCLFLEASRPLRVIGMRPPRVHLR